KRIRAEVGKESRLAEKSEAGQSGRLKEKRADLSENRGDSRRNQTGGSKKPKQKQRLKFAYEETGASVKNDKDMEKLNQMDTDGVNFRHQKQKEKAKKFSYEEARKKKEAKQHSKKAQVYQANEGETPGKKKSRLKFGEGESVKTEKTSVVKKAGSATSVALHREISKNEDDNAAVEGAHKLEESGEGVYRLEQRSARRRKQWASRKRSRLERQEEKQAQAASHQEQKKLKKQIQKQQIKWDYAKAKRSEQTVGTATKGTIDYIKKIGGKVTNFFKENRKVYISVAVLIGLMFLIITNVTSCSAVFLQNVITYTGTSYLSSDQAIREAELYYTQLEANLQERINNMESEEPGHEEYRYNIGPIEHGIKDRQLHIEDYLQMVSAEQKEYAEVSAHQRIAENNDIITDFQTDRLMEKILSNDNLNQAYKKVKSNKGAGGVDGMSVDELLSFLRNNGVQLKQQLMDGKYKPNPVRRVEIPKETKGEFRKLGVPTVVDRVFQQAITQVLSPIYEEQFSENSYGFRPGRGAHDALKQCQTNVNDGYGYVVDMDLEKFFDTVCQVVSRMTEKVLQ
ncbi:CD1108 family mobile element protein, partial [Coprococcus comes]|uniref:CD1108 family mobile element protein n=1 Tax=Coprococcus comes TaxID=410072 RepID=UPI002ED0C929